MGLPAGLAGAARSGEGGGESFRYTPGQPSGSPSGAAVPPYMGCLAFRASSPSEADSKFPFSR